MRAFTGCQVVQSGSERGQPLGRGNANTKKRKEKKRGKPSWGFKEISPTCKSLILLYTFSLQQTLTLQFRSSAVLSSNSSPSLKEISVFLKVLWVRMTTLSPSWLMMTVGLVTLPTCRVAKPTPGRGGDGAKVGSTHTQEHQCTTHLLTFRVLFLFSITNKVCKREGDVPTLTQGFHVLIEVLTVDQFPGGTEGVDHDEGFLGGRVTSKIHGAAAASAGFLCPHLSYYPAPYHGGCPCGAEPGFPLAPEILPRFCLIGYLNWVMGLSTPLRNSFFCCCKERLN